MCQHKGPTAVAAVAAPATAVPGVTFAQAGSTLCGTGVCPAGQRCFDGWNCCPEATPICGGKCCQSPNTCLNNRCVEPGSIPCGTTVCPPGQTCGLNNVCCTADRKVCGQACCELGQDCVLGTCAAAGSLPCGNTICASPQTCVDGVCCNTGETACGGRCCPSGNTCLSVSGLRAAVVGLQARRLGSEAEGPPACRASPTPECAPPLIPHSNRPCLCVLVVVLSSVQNQFCAPIGSSLCGNGQICNAPQTCAGGLLCCDAGASFCGGACCPGEAAVHQRYCA